MRNFANILLALFTSILVGGMVGFIGINWIMGCGEMFPRFDGSYEVGECVSIRDLVDALAARKER